MTGGTHFPVMLREAVGALVAEPCGLFVDCTLGGGGHARLIADKLALQGRLLCLDRDPEALQRNADWLQRRQQVRTVHANFADMAAHAPARTVAGVLFDLGVSSQQLAASGRGFGFADNQSLDMRFDPGSQEPSALDYLHTCDRAALATVLRDYADERQAWVISGAIKKKLRRQPTLTAAALTRLIHAVIGHRSGRLDAATRTFMALRIQVNGEVDALKRGLQGAVRVLARGGRLVVISFQSLEDAIVKSFIKAQVQARSLRAFGTFYRATPHEIATNPRSRSAIMRVAEVL